MFTFSPLLGAQSASPASQSLLEFDGGVRILIDVGWDETFDAGKLRQIELYVSATMVCKHLSDPEKANSHHLRHLTHSSHYRASWRLRPLLQEHSTFQPYTGICHDSSHIVR